MSEVESKFETWDEVILDFFEKRISSTKLYKAREFIEKKDKEIATEKDKKKIASKNKSRAEKIKELHLLRKKSPSTEIREWIDETSRKKLAEGKRTIKITHTLKFSHSSSPPEGVNFYEKCEHPLLSTGSIKKGLVHDLAHSNGNLVSISRFLALQLKNQQIIDLIMNEDYCFLKPFVKDKNQLKNWVDGFSALVEEREIRTGEKAKQIYFPNISNPRADKDYDLIIPLFSSSLAEKIYLWVNDGKFGEVQKQISDTKKITESKYPKYHEASAINNPGVGVFKFGGAQPQNVSMLNKSRSWKADKKDKTAWGITYLFHSSPPTWETRLNPPISRQSLFTDLYNETIKTEIDYLRDFLLRFKQLDLSIKDPKRKKHLERWVNNIIDEFLFYVASIQNLPAGWSALEEVRLKEHHCYLLDPYRNDESFQVFRQKVDWQATIRADFATWLNGLLRGKDSQFTPQKDHTKLWKRLLEQPLRDHIEQIDQSIKQQTGGSV